MNSDGGRGELVGLSSLAGLSSREIQADGWCLMGKDTIPGGEGGVMKAEERARNPPGHHGGKL